jgi:hypothetical protein
MFARQRKPNLSFSYQTLTQNSDCVIKNYLKTLFIFARFKIREDRAKLRGKTIPIY